MKIVRVPSFCHHIYPKAIWKIKTDEKVIYLTFDDGPTTSGTPWILSTLNQFDFKANFFCSGKNALMKPELITAIKDSNSQVHNHGFDHLNGWSTKFNEYMKDFRRADEILKTSGFRPAYGKIKRKQFQEIAKSHNIYMWSLNSWDYTSNFNANEILNRLTKNVQPGDIVLFHDSAKSFQNLQWILPEFLEYLKENGWSTGLLA